MSVVSCQSVGGSCGGARLEARTVSGRQFDFEQRRAVGEMKLAEERGELFPALQKVVQVITANGSELGRFGQGHGHRAGVRQAKAMISSSVL